MPFDSFDQIWPTEMAELVKNVQKQRFFEAWDFQGYVFVTDGRRDLGIGSNEGIGV